MAEEYKKSISGWRTSLKNVAAEDSPENNAKKLNLFTSHEGNFQHHYVCLFFWAAPSSKLSAGVKRNATAQLFRWNHPITGKVQKVSTIVAFSYAD